jgi:hypothetical protein
MAYRIFSLDRVLETAAAPGTGTVTLGGAVAGYRSFASVGQTMLANADTCAYFIETVDIYGAPTGLWERGFGTANGNPVTTFTRSIPIDGSSGLGTLVNFTSSIRIGIAPMTDTASIYPEPGGRLSAAADGVSPVSDSPTNGLSSVYYIPYKHDKIALWNGSGIVVTSFPLLTINLPSSPFAANTAWDVFGYLNASRGLSLETLAWSNPGPTSPARATPVAYLNGFVCKNTDATRRYLGSFYCQVPGATHDVGAMGPTSAGGKRFLWNMYNRVPKACIVYDGTASWSDGTNSWHLIRAQAIPSNCVEMFRGLPEDAVSASFALSGACPQSGGFYIGISLDGATPSAVSSTSGSFYNSVPGTQTGCVTTSFSSAPPIGYHTLGMQTIMNGTIVNTFGGNYGAPALAAIMMA